MRSDEINAQNIDIKLWINNELRQESNTNQMIFPISEIIHQLSQGNDREERADDDDDDDEERKKERMRRKEGWLKVASA